VSDARCTCDECGRDVELDVSIAVVAERRKELDGTADFCSWRCVVAFASKQAIGERDPVTAAMIGASKELVEEYVVETLDELKNVAVGNLDVGTRFKVRSMERFFRLAVAFEETRFDGLTVVRSSRTGLYWTVAS
jgi:hypothetical protein